MASAGVLARARRAVGDWRAARSAPVVTVIVPVYQAEPYLEECLTSLRRQKHRRLQIVVVDDGSTDGSRDIYERHAAADGRIEVVRQANSGLGAARNAGIARARGDYLTFLDADDTLPPRAYRDMVEALEASGSDFAIGAAHRVTSGRRSIPAWIREVHHDARRGITIDDYPRAVMDVIACNRMFRLSAWTRMGLAFPEGVAYEDHVPMMTAYVRGRFDILQETTYLWRIREDGTSIGQQKHSVENLRDRLEAKRGARAVLEQEASAVVLAAWQSRVLDMDLRLFIDEVPGVDEAYWAVLREGVREHVDRATPQVWADVRVEQRVRAWLVAQDRRADLEGLLARRDAGETVVHARIEEGGRALADVELPEGDRPPTELLVVGERELALVVSIRTVTVVDDALVVVLAPRLGPVDEGLDDAALRVRLTDEQGRTVQLGTERADVSTVAQWAEPFVGPRWPDLRVARVRIADLPVGRARWRVSVEYAAGGRVFEASPTMRDPDGAAGRLTPLVDGVHALVPSWQLLTGLTIETCPADGLTAAGVAQPEGRPLLVVEAVSLTGSGLELRGRWLGDPPARGLVLMGDADATVPLESRSDGAHVVLSASWVQTPPVGMWRLRARDASMRAWVSPDLLGGLPVVQDAGPLRIGVIRDTDDAPALRVALRRY